MCGIIGVILKKDKSAYRHVLNGLMMIQNRGYDSSGIVYFKNGDVVCDKHISDENGTAIEKLSKVNEGESSIAFGHTRWATHGIASVTNAHPHHDHEKNYYLVHNGIIENYLLIKEKLNGVEFYSETDTEVMVNKIAKVMNANENSMNALYELNYKLNGSWAAVFLKKDEPDRLYFLKDGSPLIIGKGDNMMMFASELSGLSSEITEYYSVPDKSCGWIDSDLNLVINQKTPFFKGIIHQRAAATPYPWPHWTIKEINDQRTSAKVLIDKYIVNDVIKIPNFDSVSPKIAELKHIILLGCGTSYHACQIGKQIMRHKRIGETIDVIDGADLTEYDIPLKKSSEIGFILLSQSGETKDLYRCLKIAKDRGIMTIAVVNVVDSLIARESDFAIYLNAGKENAVASTKSFLHQVITLEIFAAAINQLHGSVDDDIKYISYYPTEINTVIDSCESQCKLIAHEIYKGSKEKSCNDIFILGKHSLEWIAKEGALKIKEISYLHAEGYSAASLKHGPFALLTYNVPVIIIAEDGPQFEKLWNVCEEIHSRFADIILITDKPCDTIHNSHIIKHIVSIPSFTFKTISVIPLQLIAYHLTLSFGYHPDFPRNLAKVVTVE